MRNAPEPSATIVGHKPVISNTMRYALSTLLGCQVGETGILSAAGRQFACNVKDLIAVEGSFDRHLVKEPLTEEDLTFGYRGLGKRLYGPGLGITVDEAALKHVRQRFQIVLIP